MPTTTASTPTSSSRRSDGEFDQEWEFGFNSDRGGASASDSNADSDAGYLSPVYGDRESCFSSDDDSDTAGVTSVFGLADVRRRNFPVRPRSFYQCVVLMVSDAASGVRLQPGSVVCDFEAALIDSVTDQFPHARVIGCLFHFKQATRRRMMKLRIRPQEISIAMEVGVLDMLTVIVPAHVDPHGINYVSELIMSRCRTEEIEYSAVGWDRFWKYFRRT
ncbi:hypothetical protein PHYSODRAFT_321435 [Phytophthora sojae]|uniref:MULE transposase domain-containing protein n=1 Tax=Phytophthora sojae (strain P6497) TaxID=1094619 RepID=G4YFU7_PHYSP|nr:hypothetical protein PHYSODRAFT_321435 [Phytophthora sojae]EGZ27674.1 hypothetical protein PHYSODRAFT_321435 [Phytophthora sojae]|eukprot:XP_009514949.1 hypothetical protein PHYSODRAFT_321435 [Phytophthora sojae]